MNSKKIYKIPVSWEMFGYVEVNADSLEKAIEIAESESSALPNGNYLENSFKIDIEGIESSAQ